MIFLVFSLVLALYTLIGTFVTYPSPAVTVLSVVIAVVSGLPLLFQVYTSFIIVFEHGLGVLKYSVYKTVESILGDQFPRCLNSVNCLSNYIKYGDPFSGQILDQRNMMVLRSENEGEYVLNKGAYVGNVLSVYYNEDVPYGDVDLESIIIARVFKNSRYTYYFRIEKFVNIRNYCFTYVFTSDGCEITYSNRWNSEDLKVGVYSFIKGYHSYYNFKYMAENNSSFVSNIVPNRGSNTALTLDFWGVITKSLYKAKCHRHYSPCKII